MPDAARTGEKVLRGIPVSPGVCRGKILVLGKPQTESVICRKLSEKEVPEELHRLEQALLETRRHILEVQRQVNEGIGAQAASIFDAHLLLLEDPVLIDEVTRLIERDRIDAAYAFQQVSEKYIRTLSAIEDEYLRERAADARDVTSRVVDHLAGRSTQL